MNNNFLYLLIIFLLILLSCDKQNAFVKCEDCIEQEPTEAVINIKLDPPVSMGPPVEIRIYEGNLEDGLLRSKYTTVSYPIALSVLVNKKYTVTATYIRNKVKFTAIDSATPRVRFEPERCDIPCYFIYDNELDLRIRYTQ